MSDNNPDVFWKVRVPLTLAAMLVLVLAIAEWWRTATAPTRRSVLACIVLFCVSVALFLLAGTVETWCAPPVAVFTDGAGGLTWGDHPWHQPTLRDCLSVQR